ncbi:MAG: RNA helicase [Candidatus Brocadia sp.]|uniref:DEAD-box ATP-dependent RNA helicase RhpA n=1 Tax=Candidatus Brocadia fulgida TaxID=380242 RepID=A0A0M2UTN1_9BACT|nr:MAG: ATP-dependent RNA helicase [Candidatus Brocadia fulgida]MCC6326301.1 DEAD/DEAH box helicase [Candidatus Brocadia sp.]MCE7911002.1 DEAD/DEAH box helicase [Candidatus Brocadia sp. AMX3]OQZ01559.1 MAG: RNA helicase [Candidatus Brocadia sp. UTAMX2]MBV6518056.1 ATP-dependent RNA helicase CshA [Candidatus Brocadia fulgida]
MEKFKALGLSENTLRALEKKGFEEPTPIQQKTIPILLRGEVDIIGQAQTGTGKTAAFGLPILERIPEKSKAVQALILVPTRELAIQVSDELNSLKGAKVLQIMPIYGGQSMEEQLRRLRKGIDIVVGTPGRILDHLRRKSLHLGNISYLVLDEADEMLNMGFIDDVEEIIKNTNAQKRMLLFSATMPGKIIHIAEKYMQNYEMIGVKKEQLTTNLTDQIYFEVAPSDKFDALCRIIDIEHEFYGLIFCRTKIDVDNLANKLIERGYDAEALHGDISQNQREIILSKFRKQRINILVATDVAARGIDIQNLTHVINYSLPQDPESYIHRIGRTGRAGKEGTAITFVTHDEYRRLVLIKKIAKTDIRKEKLPRIEDVIRQKKSRIKAEISQIITAEDMNGYVELAQEMLKENEAEKVLAALLKHTFQDELDESNYNEIRDISIDRKGTTRLFVALGKIDGMTPKKLITFIKQQAKVHSEKIKDIQIFDKFSFVTVPFEEAEIMLNIFKKKTGGKRPIVERAKR